MAKRRKGRALPPFNRDLLVAAFIILVAGGGLGILFNILAPRGVLRIPGGGDNAEPEAVHPEKSGVKAAGTAARNAPVEKKPVENTRQSVAKTPEGTVNDAGAPYAPKVVDLDEAKAIFRQGDAVWVDARSESSYNYGHIQGAINIPSSDFDRAYARQSGRLSRTGTIVVYCESSDCDQADHVLEKLIPKGYRNLVHFKQGWVLWEMAEMPQETK